jgi:hypothetical protein
LEEVAKENLLKELDELTSEYWSIEWILLKKARFVKKLLGFGKKVDKYKAILKNWYYHINWMKFSKYYYEYLWNNWRKAPSLIIKEVLKKSKNISPDKIKPWFYKYIYDRYELVYNPKTKEVWHFNFIK